MRRLFAHVVHSTEARDGASRCTAEERRFRQDAEINYSRYYHFACSINPSLCRCFGSECRRPVARHYANAAASCPGEVAPAPIVTPSALVRQCAAVSRESTCIGVELQAAVGTRAQRTRDRNQVTSHCCRPKQWHQILFISLRKSAAHFQPVRQPNRRTESSQLGARGSKCTALKMEQRAAFLNVCAK